MKIQARIPPALAALHNFILEHDPDERVDPKVRDPTPGAGVDPDEIMARRLQGELATERRTLEESEAGEILRDEIADAMWADYQRVLQAREEAGEMDVDSDDDNEEERNRKT